MKAVARALIALTQTLKASCPASALDASERQHVHGARHGRKGLAARRVIQPAQSAESMRVMREVDAHALLLGSDRSIAVLTPRIVRTIPPPGIEVQESLQHWSKVGSRSHGGEARQRRLSTTMG